MNYTKRVLITGGNGHIASKMAQRYLQDKDTCVMLWLHADSLDAFSAKRAVLEAKLQGASGQVEYYCGDLAAANPFGDVSPDNIDVVIHAAAVTRFNVEEELAQRVNVEGSEKLFKFCTRIPKLKRLALLSTVYTSGLHEGTIKEERLDDSAGFANYYESSKWTAEDMLQTRYAELPWQICRISTIIAEDESGAVEQYNAVHNTLKLLFYGLLPIIPGVPQTPLYFVTSEFVTESLYAVLEKAPEHKVFHVTHAREQSMSLGDLMDTCFKTFSTDEGFRKRRVIAPLFSDQQSFDRLANSVQGFGGAVMKQSVASVAPFSKQLFSGKDVRNDGLRSYLDDYVAPDMIAMVEKICLHLLSSRWDRQAA